MTTMQVALLVAAVWLGALLLLVGVMLAVSWREERPRQRRKIPPRNPMA